MKKLNFIVMPLMVVSLLASCNKSTNFCVVTFNSNGGSFIETQKVKKGGTAHEPKKPIRDKYNFNGWCLDGTTFEFSTKITKDIILVANWDKIPEPGVKHTIGFSGSNCKAGESIGDLKDIFQISCEEGEINLIVAPNDNFALTNEINFLVDGARVAPKSYTQEGSNYKLTFNLSGETLIYVDALPVSTSHKVTFSGDGHCSMFYGTQSVTSTGIEISIPDIDPYYVKFTIKANDSTYMKPGTVTLSNSDIYSFNKDTGELFINLKSQVNVSALCDIYKSLEECSWAQISEISGFRKAPEAFKVGDTKIVEVNGLNHEVRIIGFNHDTLYSSITFEFVNLITDSNGAITTFWEEVADMNYDYRESTLNDFLNDETEGANSVINMLPSSDDSEHPDLKEVIKPVDKKVGVSTDEGLSYIATSFEEDKYPKLFPLAYKEITTTEPSNVTPGEAKEQGTYEYYRIYNDKSYRVKEPVNRENEEIYYWLRSPVTNADNNAFYVGSHGSLTQTSIVDKLAIAPAFCI